jgi:hypothetical protein
MKRLRVISSVVLVIASSYSAMAQNVINVFDTVLYFDGYAAKVSSPAPPAGVIRHRNDLYARKLTSAELQLFGSKLEMAVTVKAVCDNYDRIGSVNMALVPKGASTYVPDSVKRIELGRFITPFMNKNVMPDTVPYKYNMDNVANLFQETSITSNFDIWIELEIFGVPYAANTQVAGCSGRNDVFYGSMKFITSTDASAQSNNVLVPLSFRKDLNNYNAANTDTLGKTTRTINFNLATPLSDAALFLITSNHGANNGGEEYNRREHFVSFDQNLVRSYTPGSASCEPYRKYNTQGNGIYGASTRTDAQWQSFSNWCPGDTIPVRRIDLGALTAGSHSFMIAVPDAVFVGAQGYIPLSVYLHGKTSGKLAIMKPAAHSGIRMYPNPTTGLVSIEHSPNVKVMGIIIRNSMGQKVYQQDGAFVANAQLNVERLQSGLYIMQVKTDKGELIEKLQILK